MNDLTDLLPADGNYIRQHLGKLLATIIGSLGVGAVVGYFLGSTLAENKVSAMLESNNALRTQVVELQEENKEQRQRVKDALESFDNLQLRQLEESLKLRVPQREGLLIQLNYSGKTEGASEAATKIAGAFKSSGWDVNVAEEALNDSGWVSITTADSNQTLGIEAALKASGILLEKTGVASGSGTTTWYLEPANR